MVRRHARFERSRGRTMGRFVTNDVNERTVNRRPRRVPVPRVRNRGIRRSTNGRFASTREVSKGCLDVRSRRGMSDRDDCPNPGGPLIVLLVVGLLTCRHARSKPSHPGFRAMALRLKEGAYASTPRGRMRMTAAGPSRNRTGVPCSMALREAPSTASGRIVPAMTPEVKGPVRQSADPSTHACVS